MSSSSDIAISIRGLSKSYTIVHNQEKHITLAETLLSRLKNPLRRAETATFWALKDVNLEIEKGEAVGIIGRNGAGKSTLLKILSRVTEPTAGEVDVFGRVGSLLEVGTGFHPELTGRENIYLNGAILGMGKGEIRRQFDGIVDFAGVGQFLDTPVKRYSSGMYVRLAFAVAAHLRSEILIVDEVLAVGDAEFQKKCTGKMRDVTSDGRTVLFVSHNMAAIQALCGGGVMLRSGSVLAVGEMAEVTQAYLAEGISDSDGCVDLSEHPARSRRFHPWLKSVRLLNDAGEQTCRFTSSGGLTAVLEFSPRWAVSDPRIALAIDDSYGRRIGTTASHFELGQRGEFQKAFRAEVRLAKIGLGPGRYLLSASLSERGSGMLDSVDGALWFDVEWDNTYPSGEMHEAGYGPLVLSGQWSIG